MKRFIKVSSAKSRNPHKSTALPARRPTRGMTLLSGANDEPKSVAPLYCLPDNDPTVTAIQQPSTRTWLLTGTTLAAAMVFCATADPAPGNGYRGLPLLAPGMADGHLPAGRPAQVARGPERGTALPLRPGRTRVRHARWRGGSRRRGVAEAGIAFAARAHSADVPRGGRAGDCGRGVRGHRPAADQRPFA